jgi:uncharacterized membrane protein YphA (DoxX/SURF4 family)
MYKRGLEQWQTFLRQRSFLQALRVGLGLIFAVAGISKLFPLEAFLQQVMAYRLPLAKEFVYAASVPLIALEIWAGLSLICNVHTRFSLLIMQLLLGCMIPLTIWGSINEAPSCGCYGTLVKREPWMATIEDILLLILSFSLLGKLPQTSDSNSRLSPGGILALLVVWGGTLLASIYAGRQLMLIWLS